MPRKKVDGKPVKRRSRGGCHNCKRLKIKCDETKPSCGNCQKHSIQCDYSLVLTWGGRPIRKDSRTDLTNGVVLEQISSLHKVFKPVSLEKREIQFVIENPADEDYEPAPVPFPGEESGDELETNPNALLTINKNNGSARTQMKYEEIEVDKFVQELVNAEHFEVPAMVRELSPLPDVINRVPFNRELFYHFLNVTADMMVPVPHTHYPDNPFRTLLPRLAVDTPHLLSLMLAYSASHRAKYLDIPEPTEAITGFLSQTFEGLTRSLENENEARSDSTLATAILLASYEMLCGKMDDSWRTHLNGAREIVMSRGVTDSWTLHRDAPPTSVTAPYHPTRLINLEVSRDEMSYFLLRCFAYFDVVGALCSPDASSALINNDQVTQWSFPANTEHTEVDLLLGVDLNMIPVFSRVASLIRRRATALSKEQEQELSDEATQLSQSLITSCIDVLPKNSDSHKYENQLAVMNATFCYAVLIHLYRRVLLLPSTSESVQSTVKLVTDLLEKLPETSGIIACMSFPIVTAGCETNDEALRAKYRALINSMQRFGAKNLARAKDLMEICWSRNQPWTEIMAELNWGIALI